MKRNKQTGAKAPLYSANVPRQVSRKAGAKAAAQTSEPSKETTSQQECQLVGISCTSPMGFFSRFWAGICEGIDRCDLYMRNR